MKHPRVATFFITGTDTGAGKTVLATLLTRFLREQGVCVVALKPLCSGGRDDAVALWTAAGKVLALDEVNPWHFRAEIAPMLAARRERKQVRLAEVVNHIRRVSRSFEVVVVEGAGGLLSPLGEDFASRELMVALNRDHPVGQASSLSQTSPYPCRRLRKQDRAVPQIAVTAPRGYGDRLEACPTWLGVTPIIVSPNRLGAVNQVRLTLEALPPRLSARAQVVFFNAPKPDSATRTNAALLGEFIEPQRIHRLPWLGTKVKFGEVLLPGRLRVALQNLARCASPVSR
jgi:dethiobiotin synthase